MKNVGGNYKDNLSKDKEKFAKFVELLKNNSSNKSIAELSGVSAYTVSYWRIKLSLPRLAVPTKAPLSRVVYPRSRAKLKMADTYELGGEIYRTGKDYKDYLKEAEVKRKKADLEVIHTLLKKK